MIPSSKGSAVSLFFPELSYQIGGILFRVYNELGPGYHEKHVQRAVANALRSAKIAFQEQVPMEFEFQGRSIGRYFLDFVVDSKIVLELKVRGRFLKKDFNQVKQYLRKTGLQLGLLARFGQSGVVIERVLRPHTDS